MSLVWTESDELEAALLFARGMEGRMKPNPEAADSKSAIALLRYADMIQSADEPKPPQYRPAWLWNLVSKIALRYWKWKYKGLAEERIREWYDARRGPVSSIRPYSTTPARSSTDRGATPAAQSQKKDLSK
jgi:hypothetical protein